MLKAYTGKLLEYSYIPLLYPNLGLKVKTNHLVSLNAFKFYKEPVLDIVSDPSKADFFLIPHNYFLIKSNKEYIQKFVYLSEKYEKKIIIFAQGDSDEDINIPNAVIFRTSQYRYKKKDNEIMMPPYVEDLSLFHEFKPRQKTAGIPVVGFCGWARTKGVKQAVKNTVKNLFFDIKKLINSNPEYAAKKQGLFFRKKAIKALIKSKSVKSNFIIRDFYSGYKKNIGISPEKARQDYIGNMEESDFALVVKGDGNFSFRFYEALSAGRIPFFINTECVLPLADILNYREFVLFLDYKKINLAGQVIGEFYEKIDNDRFLKMQTSAKETFDKFLRIDKFFEIMFLKEKIKDYL